MNGNFKTTLFGIQTNGVFSWKLAEFGTFILKLQDILRKRKKKSQKGKKRRKKKKKEKAEQKN